MDFVEKLNALSKKVKDMSGSVETEQATKSAFIMPFIQILGYDVFNPAEVIPEFTADIGKKKGEKVDYAILKDGEIKIIIECKKIGAEMTLENAQQLFRYFSTTKARIAILTNGRYYNFYTDLEKANIMDASPFLVLDVLNIDEYQIPELKKLNKSFFDLESIINSAEELKYLSLIKKEIATQFAAPDEDFVKYFASKAYSGVRTQKIIEQFTFLTKKALSQFLTDQVNDRLKTALGNVDGKEENEPIINQDDGIVTTEEELDGFNVVRAIGRQVTDVKNIVCRDTKSYFGILYKNNNRTPICRLHFNRQQKYIETFDGKEGARHPIENVDGIFLHAESIINTIKSYEESNI